MRDRHMISDHCRLGLFCDAARLADHLHVKGTPSRLLAIDMIVREAIKAGDLAAAQDICEGFPRDVTWDTKLAFAREYAAVAIVDDDRTVLDDVSETIVYESCRGR